MRLFSGQRRATDRLVGELKHAAQIGRGELPSGVWVVHAELHAPSASRATFCRAASRLAVIKVGLPARLLAYQAGRRIGARADAVRRCRADNAAVASSRRKRTGVHRFAAGKGWSCPASMDSLSMLRPRKVFLVLLAH
jgi:hypothetical protein